MNKDEAMNTEIAYLDSPIGLIKIKVEDGLITAVGFSEAKGDEETEGTSEVLKMAILQLEEYFAGTRLNFDFPFKQPGTPFQQSVWETLMQIDYGTTISYLQQSQRMGDPLAIRAIASSNGKNNMAIVVPCHRVIGSNGSLTGYAGGIWRKQWLLDHEAKISGVGQMKLF